MKLISLNIWGGRVRGPLLDFLKNHEDIDIFCLQEVYHDAKGKELIFTDAELDFYEDIKKALINYDAYFRPHLEDYFGLAIFVKKNLNVIEEGEHYVHKHKGYVPTDNVGFHAKNIQYVKISLNQEVVTIVNFHGLWNGKGKTDTPDRIEQSKKIKNHINLFGNKVVLVGDFNLLPDTESLGIVSNGMKDLIKEFNVTSTRTKLYNKHTNPVLFADYIFTSPDLHINDFKVLTDEVSDHSPLFLDFN